MTKAKKDYKKAVWEAVKEPLRLLVIAVLPVVIAYLMELPFEWAAFVVVVLRFVDKLLHEVGKVEKSETLIKGITQF